MKRGFTIIELLVASLLLSMLVTILTMMFNQSSIAWRTGTAGVVNMNTTRASIGTFADIRDDLLPGLKNSNPTVGSGDNRTLEYRTVSLWKKDGSLRRGADRAFSTVEGDQWGKANQFGIDVAINGGEVDAKGSAQNQNVSMFAVGVRSLGPDGKPDTEDDITTWPEEID